MPGNAAKTLPIDWMIFQSLMKRMNEKITELDGFKQTKFAIYQTIIAIGCHFGPSFEELTRFRWIDIMGIGQYNFKFEVNRSPIVVSQELSKVVSKNYSVINPYSSRDYIMDRINLSPKPISARKFNTALQNIFEELGLQVPYPCAQTLRKTYARHVWEQHNMSDDIIKRLSIDLGYEEFIVRSFIKL